MDRLSQADAVIAAALAHRPAVVVPGHVLSPMDCDTTIPVTRTVVRSCDLRAHADAATGEDSPDRGEVDPAAPATGGELLDEEMLRASQGLQPARGVQRPA